jgi:hypothetical protein
MKIYLLRLLLLVLGAIGLDAQTIPAPREATAAQATEGTAGHVFISPRRLAGNDVRVGDLTVTGDDLFGVNGLRITASTTTNKDLALASSGTTGSIIFKSGSTTQGTFVGGGGLLMAGATGGNPGLGVINAAGLKINGVDVGTSSSSYWNTATGGISYGSKVGIGTTTPQSKLEVDNRNVGTGIAFAVTGGTDSLSPVTGQYTGIGLGYGGASNYIGGGVLWEFTNANGSGNLHFANKALSAGGTVALADSKMVIQSDGNAAFTGTVTAPDYTLGTSGPSVASSLGGRAMGQAIVGNGAGASSFSGPTHGTSNFTWAFWARSDSINSANQAFFGGVTNSATLYVSSASSYIRLGKVNVSDYTNATTPLINGKTHHIAVTRNGNTATYYIDGKAAGTADVSGVDFSGQQLYIGAHSGGAYYLNGSIGGIVIENRSLSAAEIKALAETGINSADLPAISASNSNLAGGTFANYQYDTFTGATSAAFTAVETGGQTCIASSSSSGSFLGLEKAGTRFQVEFSATLTSGAAPAAYFAINGGSSASNAVTVTAGANSHTFAITAPFTAETAGGSGQLIFATSGNTSYSISGLTIKRLGALAYYPEQAGRGSKWFDASGNGYDLTLGTGTAWARPASLNTPLGGGATIAASTAGAVTVASLDTANVTTTATSGEIIKFNRAGYSGGLTIYGDGTGPVLAPTDTSDVLRLFTGGNERVRIDEAGKVGIGMTPTASSSLQVFGDIGLYSGNIVRNAPGEVLTVENPADAGTVKISSSTTAGIVSKIEVVGGYVGSGTGEAGNILLTPATTYGGKVKVAGALNSSGKLTLTNSASSSAIEFYQGATYRGSLGVDNGGTIAIGAPAGDVVLRSQTGPLHIAGEGGNDKLTIHHQTGNAEFAGSITGKTSILNTGTYRARFEATGASSVPGGTGSGIEIWAGNIVSYNRTSAAYSPLLFDASGYTFGTGNATFAGSATITGTTTVNGGSALVQATGATTKITLNQVGTASWDIANLVTSGNLTFTQGGIDHVTVAKTTGAVTFAGTITAGSGSTQVTDSAGKVLSAALNTVAVGQGGTGATTLSANAVLLGNGTSALQTVAPGASGNILTSNGTTWASTAPAGATYAEIYVADGAASQSIATGATYAKLSAFTTNGESNNCTAAAASDKITITTAGTYRISFSVSLTSDTNNVYWHIAPFLNGAEQAKGEVHLKNGTGADVISGSGTLLLNVSSVPVDLDLRARHESAGSVLIVPTHANLNASRIN